MRVKRGGTVYIMTNLLRTVLYTGVTSDLIMRVQEHKIKVHPESFTAKYNVIFLVYYKGFSTMTKLFWKRNELNREAENKNVCL
jgi:putative endonuclease